MKTSKDDFAGLSRVKFHKIDITKVEEIQDAIDQTVQWTQDTKAPLGGVIHCAGIGAASVVSDCTVAKNVKLRYHPTASRERRDTPSVGNMEQSHRCQCDW